MTPSAISARYSRALAEVAFEEKLEQRVADDLRLYTEIFQAAPDLSLAFHSPSVPRESKERLLEALIEKFPVCQVTSNFLRILLQRNRLRHLQQIADGYSREVNARKGIISARIRSVVPLSGQDLEKLQARLAEVTGKRVQIEAETDPDLLGGVVVQIGSTVYDGSIKTQLRELRRRLAGKI